MLKSDGLVGALVYYDGEQVHHWRQSPWTDAYMLSYQDNIMIRV